MSESVLEALCFASSQNPSQVKLAEQKYAEWSTQPGFYQTLAQIVANESVDVNWRLMALIWLKNAVNKYWRPTLPNALSEEEKNHIRAYLLQAYPRSSNLMGKQLAEIIARIVRHDPLNGWPQLMPELMKGIEQGEDGIKQSRALMLLLHVSKGLSARTTLQERKFFENLTSQIYQFMGNAWIELMRLFMTGVKEGRTLEENSHLLEKAVLSLKIVKKLNLFGIYKPHQNEMCNQFFRNFLPPIDELLHCRLYLLQKPEYQPLIETFEKYVVRHMKLLYEFQDRHIASFEEFIPSILDFAYDHVFGEKSALIRDENRVHFPAFAIYCFNLIKSQLSYDDKVPKYSMEVDKKMVKITDSYFTDEKIHFAVDKLISIYFLITEVELNNWEDDPEEYVSEESGDSWKYSMRCSAEALFMVLCKCYNAPITLRLQDLVYASQRLELTPTTAYQDILYKEAVYNATGLASFRLFDEIDFDEWFVTYLSNELMIKDEAFKIIRRRAIWLVGKWTAVKFNKMLRPQVYAACVNLLEPSEDLVVRLVTSQTLKNIMDEFEFTPEQFLPYLKNIFSRLYLLLQDACEGETKMNILKLMSFIIQKMSLSIKQEANELVTYLPTLWEQSAENYMLKTVIASTMREIIQALGTIPDTLIAFVYAILIHSTNIQDDMHVYLIDEGLELWLKTIQHCKVPNDELIKLASNLLPVIESSSAYLRTCLHIMQAYILLIPEIFMRTYCPSIVHSLREMQKDMRSEGIIMIHAMYILMLKANPELAVEVLKHALIDVFNGVYESTVYVSELRVHLQIIARVLAMHRPAFAELLQFMGKSDGFEKILETMLEKFHLAQNNEERKLSALAIASVITEPVDAIYLNMTTILEKLNKAMLNIVQDDHESGQKVDSLVIAHETEITYEDMLDADAFDESTPHFERLQKLGLQDPVHNVPLHEFIQRQIATIRQNLGETNYVSLMSAVDADVLRETSLFIDFYIPIPEASTNDVMN